VSSRPTPSLRLRRAAVLAGLCLGLVWWAPCCSVNVGDTIAIATGRVRESGTEAPIEGAFVVLAGYERVTDADGMFMIEGLVVPESGEGTFSVSRDAYRTFDGEFLFDAPGDLIIDLEPVPNVQLAGTLDGSVHGATGGDPVAGAEITVKSIVGTSIVDEQTTHTSALGNWQVSGVGIGLARVEAVVDGYLPAQVDVEVAPGQASNRFLALEVIEGTSRVTIAGRVFDIETQEPIVGAVIGDDESDRTVLTDAQGAYTLTEVLVGNRTFSATAEGYDPAFVSLLVLAEPGPVNIGMASASDTPPPPAGTVAGTVTVTGAESNAGVGMNLRDAASGALLEHTTTDASGACGFLVKPGAYKLEAVLSGYATATVTVTYVFGAPVQDIHLTLQPL